MLPDGGSSPQARGTLGDLSALRFDERFIPAGAGNTATGRRWIRARPVHPRRRGEHVEGPPAAGTKTGSSPQARGTQAGRDGHRRRHRFIPAGAGNTGTSRESRSGISVHPRRRGEHGTCPTRRRPRPGSSPQARGTPGILSSLIRLVRFIPAGAGNTYFGRRGTTPSPVHPRRRGEHHDALGQGRHDRGSSPQARGTHGDGQRRRRGDRFIPAGAGNTSRRQRVFPPRSVHPRRRGEHSSCISLILRRKILVKQRTDSHQQIYDAVSGRSISALVMRAIIDRPVVDGNSRA